MKRIIFLSVVLFTAALIYPASRIEKIAIFNMQKVIEVCFKSKSKSVQQIVNEKEKLQVDLNLIKSKIDELQSSSDKETDSTKKSQLDSKISTLKDQYSAYYKKRMSEIENLEKNVMPSLYGEIYNVVKKVSETESYTIVMKYDPNIVFYYTAESDITDKIISHFQEHQ